MMNMKPLDEKQLEAVVGGIDVHVPVEGFARILNNVLADTPSPVNFV